VPRSTRVLSVLLAVAATVAGGVWLVTNRAPERPPNVLFIVWDTVRADHLSLYGYDRPTTPRLDAFARDAVVYERATAPGMWTLNSHAAMFTGLYEATHGATPSHRWLDEHHTTVAEILKGAGYDTFAFSTNLIASPMANLLQGFDVVHTAFPRADDPRGRYMKDSKAATLRKVIPTDASTENSPAFGGDTSDSWSKSLFKDAAPVAHQALVDFLDEREGKERPFYAFLNLMEAHTPRLPSMEARRKVSDEATIRCALETDQSLYAEKEHIVGARTYTEGELAGIRATYDATLVDLDAATGDLLDDLRGRGLLDDTVVVIVADHGESLGEHRMLEHRWTVHDPLLHVPLVIRYPDRLPAGRVDQRVSTADLFATVLDLAGQPTPEGTRSTSLVGRTAYDPVVYSQMLDPFASELVTVSEVHPDIDLTPWLRTWDVAFEEKWKLWCRHDAEGHHLFDLDADPGELDDRSAAEPERAGRMVAALRAWASGLPPYDPGKQLPGERLGRQTTEEQRALEQAQLQMLGYVSPDVAPARPVREVSPSCVGVR
jgi:arylsulfatase A-like enzyme